MTSHNIGKLSEALSKAQAEMQHAIKDSTNPHFKSSYADLASVLDAIRPALTKHGLCITQTMKTEAGTHFLVTTLMHTSGEFIEGSIPLLIEKNNMQGMGSAITYARRYGLAAMVGIHQADDDGNEASSGNRITNDKNEGSKAGSSFRGKGLSDKQAAWLKKLLSEAGLGKEEQEALKRKYGVTSFMDLSNDGFNGVKDYLQQIVDDKVTPFEAAPSRIINNSGEF